MWIWLGIAVLAAIGEMLTFDLFLASVSAAAVLVALVSLLPLLGGLVGLQIGAFALLSLVGIAFIRPALKRTLGIEAARDAGPLLHTVIEGRQGVVTTRVDAGGGTIRVGEGEFWTARSFDLAESFEPGAPVQVVLVDGLTALVEAAPASELTMDATMAFASPEKGISIMISLAVFAVVVLLFITIVGFKSIRLVPQARVVNVQRLGRYRKTVGSGPVFVIPFVDKILPTIDLREQVVPFAPQAVITSDNVGIQVATVVYYQIIDAKNSAYAVVDLVAAMEQLTITTLRNVIGGLTLDKTLTSREEINSKMRVGLDEVTEGWGVRVTRVELKDIIPPHDVQQAMEKQMQAEREKRAAILRAEGERQSAILEAEGQKQAAILQAEGQRQALILRAQGDAQALVTTQQAQAEAISLVFNALTTTPATPEILKYLYLQVLPKIAEGSANKLFMIPSELQGIANLGATFGVTGENGDRPAPTSLPGMGKGRGL